MWRSRGVAAVTAPNDPAAAAAAGLQARPASKKSSSTQTAGCSGAGDGGCDIAAWGHRRRRVRGVPSWRTVLHSVAMAVVEQSETALGNFGFGIFYAEERW